MAATRTLGAWIVADCLTCHSASRHAPFARQLGHRWVIRSFGVRVLAGSAGRRGRDFAIAQVGLEARTCAGGERVFWRRRKERRTCNGQGWGTWAGSGKQRMCIGSEGKTCNGEGRKTLTGLEERNRNLVACSSLPENGLRRTGSFLGPCSGMFCLPRTCPMLDETSCDEALGPKGLD